MMIHQILFMLKDDLNRYTKRVIIHITDEDDEFFYGTGDDKRVYTLRKRDLYKIQCGPKGISVFGYDEEILSYLNIKFYRDLRPNDFQDEVRLTNFENQYSHIICTDLTQFLKTD